MAADAAATAAFFPFAEAIKEKAAVRAEGKGGEGGEEGEGEEGERKRGGKEGRGRERETLTPGKEGKYRFGRRSSADSLSGRQQRHTGDSGGYRRHVCAHTRACVRRRRCS